MTVEAFFPYLALGAFLVSFVAHEIAHGIAACFCGDRTAYDAGRITLNPIKHMDLFGSVIVPAIFVMMQAGMCMGWGKPVPVDASKFCRRQKLFVFSAGILVNLMLAAVGFLSVLVGHGVLGTDSPLWLNLIFVAFFMLLPVNLAMTVFNLIPLPPLDGWRIFSAIFGGSETPRWTQKPWALFPMIVGFGLGGSMLMKLVCAITDFLIHI